MIVKNIHVVAVLKQNGDSSFIQFQKVYETVPTGVRNLATPTERTFFMEDARGYITSISEETFDKLQRNPIS